MTIFFPPNFYIGREDKKKNSAYKKNHRGRVKKKKGKLEICEGKGWRKKRYMLCTAFYLVIVLNLPMNAYFFPLLGGFTMSISVHTLSL